MKFGVSYEHQIPVHGRSNITSSKNIPMAPTQ